MTGADPGPVSTISKYTKTLSPHSSSMRKIPFKPVFAKKNLAAPKIHLESEREEITHAH